MKNSFKTLFFIAILCLLSCINKNSNSYNPPIFAIERAVQAEILNNNCMIGMPAQPIIYDSLLLFIDYSSKNKIQVFNRITGEFIKSFLQKGSAYEEIGSDYLILSLDHVNGLLYIFDQDKNRLSSFDLNKILKDSVILINNSFIINNRLRNGSEVKVVGDSLFMSVGRGYKNNDRFIFSYPTIDKHVYTATSYDSKIFEDANQWVKFMSNSNFEIAPDGNTLVASTGKNGGILEIYDISDTVELKCVKKFYKPIFGKHFSPTRESMAIFKDFCVTNEHIYSTVWLRSTLDLVQYPNTIWKFNLEGEPIASYICNSPIVDFVVDEKSQIAYGFVCEEDGNIAIAKIDLTIK